MIAAHGNILLPMLVLLLAGGGGLMLWAASQGKGLPSRRLHLMQEETSRGPRSGAKYTPDWKEDTAVWYAEGLSPEERWQIVRSFSKINMSPTMALAFFLIAGWFSPWAAARSPTSPDPPPVPYCRSCSAPQPRLPAGSCPS